MFLFTVFRFSPWHPHSAPHPTDTCYFQSQSRDTLGVFPVLVSAGSPKCQVPREVLIVKGPSYRSRRSSLPCCSAQPSPDRGDLISIYSVASSVSFISKSQSQAAGVRRSLCGPRGPRRERRGDTLRWCCLKSPTGPAALGRVWHLSPRRVEQEHTQVAARQNRASPRRDCRR